MQADELRTAMAALEQDISNLRAVLAEAELAQNDDSIGDVRNRLESVISHSEAHQDGAKMMFKTPQAVGMIPNMTCYQLTSTLFLWFMHYMCIMCINVCNDKR